MAENKRSFRKQKARLQLRRDTNKDVQNRILGMPSSDFNSDFVLLFWLESENISNSLTLSVHLVDERNQM